MIRRHPLSSRWQSLAVTVAFFASLAWGTASVQADPRTEAAALSHVAHSKATAGQWDAAAELYMQAYRTDASVLGYLASAATSFFKAEKWSSAADAYADLLEKLPEHDERRVKASQRLATARQRQRKSAAELAAEAAKRRKAEAAKAAEIARIKRENERLRAQTTQQNNQQATEKAAAATAKRALTTTKVRSRRLQLALVGGAGALALIGGGVAVWTGLSAGEALEQDLTKRNGDGKVIGLGHDEALAAQSAANRWIGAGLGLAVAGTAAVGVALWQYGRGADTAATTAEDANSVWFTPTWSPTLRGGLVQVRF